MAVAAAAISPNVSDQLAQRLGKPPSFVAKIETGERRLDIVEFIAIARALNVRPADFAGQVDGAIPEQLDF